MHREVVGMLSMRIIVILSVLAVLLAACAPEREQQPEEASPAPEPEPSPQQPAEQYAISVVSAPSNANANTPFAVTWKISGPETAISHTAVHYDTFPHTREFGTDTTTAAAAYPSLTHDFAQGSFKIPREFTATVTPSESGGIYWRAHALIGGKNYWTEERIVKVAPSPATVAEQPVTSYSVEADDYGFYRNGETISSLEVPKGGNVTLTFQVRAKNVYFGGLDFRSSKFETDVAAPGSETTANFTAEKNFIVTSYWPKTSRKKAGLSIMVK